MYPLPQDWFSDWDHSFVEVLACALRNDAINSKQRGDALRLHGLEWALLAPARQLQLAQGLLSLGTSPKKVRNSDFSNQPDYVEVLPVQLFLLPRLLCVSAGRAPGQVRYPHRGVLRGKVFFCPGASVSPSLSPLVWLIHLSCKLCSHGECLLLCLDTVPIGAILFEISSFHRWV